MKNGIRSTQYVTHTYSSEVTKKENPNLEAGVEHQLLSHHRLSTSRLNSLLSASTINWFFDFGGCPTAELMRNWDLHPSPLAPLLLIPNDSGPAVWQCMHDWAPSGDALGNQWIPVNDSALSPGGWRQ